VNSSLHCGLSLGLLGMGLWGCATGTVELVEQGDKASRKRVLIAMRQSRFKDAVAKGVLRGLEEDKCYVKVIDLKKASGQTPAEYGAVVILNACRAMNMERHARSFLGSVPDGEKDKIIVLTTTRTGWEAKDQKVDAISSASKMEDASSLAETLVGKIRAVLIRRIRP